MILFEPNLEYLMVREKQRSHDALSSRFSSGAAPFESLGRQSEVRWNHKELVLEGLEGRHLSVAIAKAVPLGPLGLDFYQAEYLPLKWQANEFRASGSQIGDST